MEKIKIEDIPQKIAEGLVLSNKRLIETKIKNNGKLAYSKNGKVVVVNAFDMRKPE
jgi:hypothetical protein